MRDKTNLYGRVIKKHFGKKKKKTDDTNNQLPKTSNEDIPVSTSEIDPVNSVNDVKNELNVKSEQIENPKKKFR